MPLRNIAIFAKKCNQKTITNILKRLQELLIKRYGQFNFSQKSESMKFKSGIRLRKGLRKFMTGKACEPLRKIMTFSKNCNQKSMISVAKTQNTHKLQKCSQKGLFIHKPFIYFFWPYWVKYHGLYVLWCQGMPKIFITVVVRLFF